MSCWYGPQMVLHARLKCTPNLLITTETQQTNTAVSSKSRYMVAKNKINRIHKKE